MTSDLNRGVTAISYQPSTGRPVEIRTSAGAVTRHLRDAAGNRLRSVRTLLSQTPEAPALELLLTAANSQTDSTVTDRVEGRYVYEEGELVRIEHADGYINNPLAEEPDYRYFVRDHTGSNVAVTGTPHGGSYQINHYYPFGMPLGCDYCPWMQDRKFGNKELDRVSGLNLMDFEARIYDPTTGRFYTPDPLSHINYPISPYAYCANSPISHSDPTGMFIDKSMMSDEDREIYDTTISILLDGSKLFATIYNNLELSDKSYTIVFEDVVRSVNGNASIPGNFIPNDEGGTITFNRQQISEDYPAFVEEMFHAYQHDIKDEYGLGPQNFEYEAKVFLTIAGATDPIVAGQDKMRGSSFRNNIIQGKYGNSNKLDDQSVSLQSVISFRFLNDYIQGAIECSRGNIQNNIGGSNYKIIGTEYPKALQKAIFQTYYK